jgi:hypothetical protein
MDLFAKPAPGEDEPKLMGQYASGSNCATAIAHFLLTVAPTYSPSNNPMLNPLLPLQARRARRSNVERRRRLRERRPRWLFFLSGEASQ